MTFTLLCGKIYQKEEKMVEPTEFKEMLKGVTAIMVTPFTDEGEVSEERRPLLARQVARLGSPCPNLMKMKKSS